MTQTQPGLLSTELSYFENNQEELFRKFPNRYLVISGETVEGNYETFKGALTASMEAHGSEPVLIRRPGDKTKTLIAPALTLGLL